MNLPPLQRYIQIDKYARWREELGRRETWPETDARVMVALEKLAGGRLARSELRAMEQSMLDLEVLPSMRLVAMAGAAFERDNTCAYNCSALAVNRLEAFYDAVILSMSGAGVTYSVEQRYISQLPIVAPSTDTIDVFTVPDTTEGWAAAILWAVRCAYAGITPVADTHLVRKKGSILKTKGGRASGPEPLVEAIQNIARIISGAAGRRSTSLELSDAMCWVASASVCGGVRRTAMMALFDYDDAEMIAGKADGWWAVAPVRENATFNRLLPADRALEPDEMDAVLAAMLEGTTGEPGFFNRRAAIARLRATGRADIDGALDTVMPNPCDEVLLFPEQLCNLTMVVARHYHTRADLVRLAGIAATIGTVQALATNLPSLTSPRWVQNAERERLLGVSVSGWMDCAIARIPQTMRDMRDAAVQANRQMAERLGIPAAPAVTSVKPAGNSGLLAGCAHGIHAWHYPHAIRRVTLNEHEPLYQVLAASGVPMIRKRGTTAQWLAEFPISAPPGAITQADYGALQQLEFYRLVNTNYAQHTVSVTIGYVPDEIPAIKRWVHQHQDEVIGLSFMRRDLTYPQAPIEEITPAEYERRVAEFPEIRWELLNVIEREDRTTAAQEVACAGGRCELGGDVMPGFTL